MEETVMSLGLSILSGGFSVDEANHEGVCVQEVPQEEQPSAQLFPGMKYETYLAYSQKKTESVEALATTFSKAHFIVYGTLSHSHLFLILRAMPTGAKWPIKGNGKGAGLNKLQDPEGRWSVSALAAIDPKFS